MAEKNREIREKNGVIAAETGDIRPPQTIETIADELGITRQALHEWYRRGCPRGSAEAAKEWRERSVMPRMGGPKTGAKSTGNVQEAILLGQAVKIREEGRSKKLKNDVLEGKLGYIEDFKQAFAIAFVTVKTDLEMLKDSLIRELPPEQRDTIGVLIEEKIHQALLKLSQTQLPEPGSK